MGLRNLKEIAHTTHSQQEMTNIYAFPSVIILIYYTYVKNKQNSFHISLVSYFSMTIHGYCIVKKKKIFSKEYLRKLNT